MAEPACAYAALTSAALDGADDYEAQITTIIIEVIEDP
jgi:hypothetical protein